MSKDFVALNSYRGMQYIVGVIQEKIEKRTCEKWEYKNLRILQRELKLMEELEIDK